MSEQLDLPIVPTLDDVVELFYTSDDYSPNAFTSYGYDLGFKRSHRQRVLAWWEVETEFAKRGYPDVNHNHPVMMDARRRGIIAELPTWGVDRPETMIRYALLKQ